MLSYVPGERPGEGKWVGMKGNGQTADGRNSITGRYDNEITSLAQVTEDSVLETLVKGTAFTKSDVVAIVLQSEHSFHAQKYPAELIYLTQRGVAEAQQPELKPAYDTLQGYVFDPSQVVPFTQAVSSFANMVEQNADNEIPTRIIATDIKGPDDKKRVILQYIKDTTKQSF